jgi:tripartite-type tricarboxylate transporter receptor subunit TctC
VPYKSGAPALIDLIAGQTQMQFVNVPPSLAHVKTGKVRPLGVTSASRVALLPQVPTISESGVPGFEDYQWQGLIGPAGVPQPVVAKLHRATAGVLGERDVRDRLSGMGAEIASADPDRLNAFIKAQVDRWLKVITPAMRID